MEKQDWYSILKSCFDDEIHWSPFGKLNVRARKRGDQYWRMGSCPKATYAETTGYRLIYSNDGNLTRRKS